ncbi:MauE/DoxX family redox-associated membrane protein [Pedobacter sp. UC225_61]|uniref:MauE/DoxX family redox-associated membrane protein n=1 Tax=Pedobacter sp. UC225_61 TaxID=3374623 RepID=UPI0037A2FBC0
MSKIALTFSRWFVGVLFIFSGLIKANDPLGFGYKLQEYFEVFHLTFLSNWATGIAIILCVLEIVLGALLLFGFWRNQVTKGLLALIIFFTFLTFVSAAFKVVTSCGCFRRCHSSYTLAIIYKRFNPIGDDCLFVHSPN